jgi:hypothetical protein
MLTLAFDHAAPPATGGVCMSLPAVNSVEALRICHTSTECADDSIAYLRGITLLQARGNPGMQIDGLTPQACGGWDGYGVFMRGGTVHTLAVARSGGD